MITLLVLYTIWYYCRSFIGILVYIHKSLTHYFAVVTLLAFIQYNIIVALF
jgi:hypothetical protein